MLRQRFHQFFFHGLNLCRFESKREDRSENRLIDHSSDRAHFTTGPEIGKKKSIRKKPDNSTLIRLLNFGAVGETRTHTTFVTTPSRWRVYQFHHDGLELNFLVPSMSTNKFLKINQLAIFNHLKFTFRIDHHSFFVSVALNNERDLTQKIFRCCEEQALSKDLPTEVFSICKIPS